VSVVRFFCKECGTEVIRLVDEHEVEKCVFCIKHPGWHTQPVNHEVRQEGEPNGESRS
jgi:hypothetical protein